MRMFWDSQWNIVGRYRNKATLDIEVEDIDRKELMESEDRLGKDSRLHHSKP